MLDNPEKADRNQDHILSWRESISLGLALAMNCIASGFGAGISGVSPVWTSVSVGVFSLITIELGIRIGYRLADTWIGRYANAIGGILLIGIGLYEIFV
ncbi:manganese efflux pump [Paenibacillus sp. P26]|nr:manganese efflux pump [Paenibacillus sp. P26]